MKEAGSVGEHHLAVLFLLWPNRDFQGFSGGANGRLSRLSFEDDPLLHDKDLFITRTVYH